MAVDYISAGTYLLESGNIRPVRRQRQCFRAIFSHQQGSVLSWDLDMDSFKLAVEQRKDVFLLCPQMMSVLSDGGASTMSYQIMVSVFTV